MPKILVTGGTGYIGSHTCVELLQKGFGIVVLDNLSNSNADVIQKIQQITGKTVDFVQGDLRDDLDELFSKSKFDAVIHFAGLKAVGESVAEPLKYYDNNVAGTVNLLQYMAKHSVKKIIFSSSATVYGNPETLPIREETPTGTTTNPYGTTKSMVEQILKDVTAADPKFIAVLLRYFNPIGAHESGLIGENPNGIPNNLAPYIAQVAQKLRPHLNVFGNDYNTADGTGVRDYIHVVDLALGHVAALEKIEKPGTHIYNLGTGNGTSVLELIAAYEKASGKKIPYKISPRRPGDIDACYADCDKAFSDLGWRAMRDIDDMCRSIDKYICS